MFVVKVAKTTIRAGFKLIQNRTCIKFKETRKGLLNISAAQKFAVVLGNRGKRYVVYNVKCLCLIKNIYVYIYIYIHIYIYIYIYIHEIVQPLTTPISLLAVEDVYNFSYGATANNQ